MGLSVLLITETAVVLSVLSIFVFNSLLYSFFGFNLFSTFLKWI